jgi:hypothetical protein
MGDPDFNSWLNSGGESAHSRSSEDPGVNSRLNNGARTPMDPRAAAAVGRTSHLDLIWLSHDLDEHL